MYEGVYKFVCLFAHVCVRLCILVYVYFLVCAHVCVLVENNRHYAYFSSSECSFPAKRNLSFFFFVLTGKRSKKKIIDKL